MNRYPFPIPFGWFMVGYSEDLPVGAVQPRYYFDRHLVVWRDERGAAHTQDAFCPHLGAHLGHGGSVEGECVVCPFHGWKYDETGANVEVPYSDRVNRRAQLRTYPTVERNGLIMCWYHPHEAPPTWEIPEVPEFADDPNWSTVVRTHYTVDAAWQEMAENGVDMAHFRFVHHTATVPQIEEYRSEGAISQMRSSQKFVTPRGVVEARIDAQGFGPGVSLVSFAGVIDTLNLAVTTPITAERCEMWFNFRFATLGDEQTTANVGKAFVAEVDKQVREDQPIWEHKAHLVRPALIDNDGPFMKFRRWASQFYADPIDEEGTVFPSPYWPDRFDEAPSRATASARLGA